MRANGRDDDSVVDDDDSTVELFTISSSGGYARWLRPTVGKRWSGLGTSPISSLPIHQMPIMTGTELFRAVQKSPDSGRAHDLITSAPPPQPAISTGRSSSASRSTWTPSCVPSSACFRGAVRFGTLRCSKEDGRPRRPLLPSSEQRARDEQDAAAGASSAHENTVRWG